MYENTGRLFKNDRKQSANQPDYTGDFTDESGKKWRLAAWLKDGNKGKWMSLKVSEDTRGDERGQMGTDGDAPTGGGALDDEIGF